MTKLAEISGVHLRFRLVEPEDAEYIFDLRTDPRYNSHLSAVSGTSRDQRAWIENYKEREDREEEYYFVIERLSDGERCGVVRLYEIKDGTFTWGSWILDHRKPSKAAFESAHLIYVAAFDRLGLERAVFDVRLENVRVIDFHRRFGAREIRTDDLNVYFDYEAATFRDSKDSQMAFLLEQADRKE